MTRQLRVVFDDYSRVLMIPDFENECEKILGNSGEQKRYYRALKKKCEYIQENIDNHGGRYRSGFLESMQGKDAVNLSKIPISGQKKNYRVLLCFIRIKGIEYAVFLHLFQEKRRKSDYRKAITLAQKRYRDLIQNMNGEQ